MTLRTAENDRSLFALVAGATSIRTTSFTTSERKVEFVLRDLKYVTTSIKVGSFGLFSKHDFKSKVEFLEGVYQNHSDRDLGLKIVQHRN